MAFPDGWQRKCAIVIQAALVAEILTDFPLLVTGDNLPAEIWANADDGGGDLRFSADDAGAVRLACEIVSFSTSGETAEIYVKVPSVSSAVNTTIYVWYNNTGQTQPAATDTYGSQAVWGSDYAAVYHFNQNPAGGTLLDSTANGNNGTPQGGMNAADLVDGQISANSAWDFDAINDYVIINNAIIQSYPFTLMMISKSLSNKQIGFSSANNLASNESLWLRVNPQNKVEGTIYIGSVKPTTGTTVVGETFVNTAYSATSAILQEVYLNGVKEGENTVFATFPTNVNNVAINSLQRNAPAMYDGGLIDEVRILTTPQNGNQLLAQNNNLFNPATFAIAGTPTAVSAFNPAWAKHSNQIIRAL